MDNIDTICRGADNLDLMSKQIKQVVMRIADYVDTKARDESSNLVARTIGQVLQIGDWWIYTRVDGGRGIGIRVDFSATSFMLVASPEGQYIFQQPNRYHVKEIRAKLPVFLTQMEAEFSDIKEWFKPFHDAADVQN